MAKCIWYPENPDPENLPPCDECCMGENDADESEVCSSCGSDRISYNSQGTAICICGHWGAPMGEVEYWCRRLSKYEL